MHWWMVLDAARVSEDGRECNKVGTSYPCALPPADWLVLRCAAAALLAGAPAFRMRPHATRAALLCRPASPRRAFRNQPGACTSTLGSCLANQISHLYFADRERMDRGEAQMWLGCRQAPPAGRGGSPLNRFGACPRCPAAGETPLYLIGRYGGSTAAVKNPDQAREQAAGPWAAGPCVGQARVAAVAAALPLPQQLQGRLTCPAMRRLRR